ncbi:MAG: HlyC/CorC family transporter [Eubacterium sp.]|mgnify:FL=1|uniref:HlyC/CorC family transporter n=1 Tax=uncultured Eubacterium sp. TaxID=165185 RepID=UPI0026194773|nr:hemolysin family protein [uncultured Eubacterium sp.]MBS5652949.1 HlyC/CorC family transporter [Eubacterium sp.]
MGPSDIALLCILFILLLLSAFFSSAETALTTFSRVRLRMLVDEGNKRAIILDQVLNNSRKMLSSVLIGNNIVNLTASSITTIFTQRVFNLSWAVSLGVGVITLAIIIFGEIIPKTVASLHAESLSLKYAPVIKFIMTVLTPVIFILNVFSSFILKIFRVNVNLNSTSITEDELRTIVGVSQEEGIIEEDEMDMINNVFDFGDACAKDIMVPKVDITMVPVDISYTELLEVIKEDKFTRMPVYKENTDNVVGILNIKDMLLNGVNRSNFNMSELMREPYFTHEKEELGDLLMEMRNKEPGMCIVLDEYGQTEGLITLEDIVEEIIGDIHDEFDEAEDKVIRQVGENEYIVEGSINLDDFNDQLDTDIDSEDYESLGGLIIEHLDRLPNKGDSVEIDNCKLTVIKMDDKRIDLVKVIVTPKEKEVVEDSEENED